MRGGGWRGGEGRGGEGRGEEGRGGRGGRGGRRMANLSSFPLTSDYSSKLLRLETSSCRIQIAQYPI